MRTPPRMITAAALLVAEAGLAVLGVLVHYGMIAEYGDVTATAPEAWLWGFSGGTNAIALVLVGAAGMVALWVSSRVWMRLTAAGIPVLMVVGMPAATPAALRDKLEVQYDAVPQCVSGEDMGPGPGVRAQRESRQAFESIEHVGYFGGGGSSGVGGCQRWFVLTGDVDVLGHYRIALPAARWRVTRDDADHLRAERDGMAFEVAPCDGGGVVWAGSASDPGGGRCDANGETVSLTG